MRTAVAFLFLGETLLIPHLYPIVEALAAEAPDLEVDVWVATSVHERLLGGWLAERGESRVRLRRVPGFRLVEDDGNGRNPPLPAKLPMLARLALPLARTPVVVCAEQTSLWLPTLLPLASRFIKVPHGAGSLMKRHDRRRRAAWRTLVAAERERRMLAEAGVDPRTISVTGYVKAAFRQRSSVAALFADRRPVVLYNPHWQRPRSSWWRWGSEAVQRIVAADRFNLIFAPHQRLVEGAPELRALCAKLAGQRHVHCDLDSFATVDGSYTAAADIYLGDTSSQVIEFLTDPRPCVFLDAHDTDWRGDPIYDMWTTGEVVTQIDDLLPALDRAPAAQPLFAERQAQLAQAMLGDLDGMAPIRAAQEILSALPARRG